MKSALCFILVIAVALTLAPADGKAQYYYSNNREIPIGVDSTKVLVKFTNLDDQEVIDWGDGIGRIGQWQEDNHVIDGFYAFSLDSKNGYYAFMDSLDTLADVALVEPYYTGIQDSALLTGDEFVTAFHADVTSDQIAKLNEHYGVLLDRPVAHMGGVFVLRNTKQSGLRMLDIANLYYNLDETIFSHPLFSLRPEKHRYEILDEYHQYQPHLKKVIGAFNIKSVWDFAQLDKPMVVAVIDDGVTTHEDLPPERILPGYDFTDGDSDPSPSLDEYVRAAHGMSVAGIIAATHKTLRKAPPDDTLSGIFSLAPNSFILPIKIYTDIGYFLTPPEATASAISYAWKSGADVVTCSFGYWALPPGYDLIAYAIDSAFTCGRGIDTLCSGNPPGCPVIFSTGNNGVEWISFPSNLESTFSVGAVDLEDYRWPYSSQYGPTLDLMAPSEDALICYGEVWSLDQMGNDGLNPFAHWHPFCGYFTWECGCLGCGINDTNYNCHFGGTSASAATVTGVATQILSFDTTLTASQVYDILRNSAVTDLDWGTITAPDLQYGYGRVDAFRAILSLARGDMNADGKYNLADITYLQNFIYLSGPDAFPDVRLGNCDCSGDGKINLADITKLIDHVYVSHDPLPVPCFDYEYPNQ